VLLLCCCLAPAPDAAAAAVPFAAAALGSSTDQAESCVAGPLTIASCLDWAEPI
jgi:hypothetical protein